MVELLFVVLLPALPWVVGWAIVNYGPVRNRWWRGENPIGFGLSVGTVAFLLGFIGPMIIFPGANQGPLLGIFYTGPIGLVIGFAWGLLRAARRGRWSSSDAD